MKKQKTTSENVTSGQETGEQPLFTGDPKRDTAVSDGEKFAEAAKALFRMIAKKMKK